LRLVGGLTKSLLRIRVWSMDEMQRALLSALVARPPGPPLPGEKARQAAREKRLKREASEALVIRARERAAVKEDAKRMAEARRLRAATVVESFETEVEEIYVDEEGNISLPAFEARVERWNRRKRALGE